MDDQNNYSRVNKYDKRRKTTKSITILMAVAIVLTIVLISVLIFGGKDEDDSSEGIDRSTAGEQESVEEENDVTEDNQQNQDNDAVTDEGVSTDDSDDEEENDDKSFIIEEISETEIEDPNVIEAYTANWKPIGTNQDEPHETVFDQESDDWKEMIEAIGYALTLELEEMTIHWVGNGGDQRVNGYVQSQISDEHYTVYLQWVENEGWQPIKVERVERFIQPN